MLFLHYFLQIILYIFHTSSFGAVDWGRTSDLLVTNELLCQLSYNGISILYHKKMADTTRLELATSAVTGRRSNQLSYVST